MRKFLAAVGLSLSLAACGSVPAVVGSIFDQIQQEAKRICGYTFVISTIEAIIKALGGPPIVETIAGLLCTQAQTLADQRAPKAATAPDGSAALDLGTVIINGRPVRIQVLR
jgi:hypothetical protein